MRRGLRPSDQEATLPRAVAGAEGSVHTAPNQALEPTANSVRYAPAVGGGSPPALGAFTLREHENRCCQCERVEFSQPQMPCKMQMQPVVAVWTRNNRGK
jgi:hypothetical protein